MGIEHFAKGIPLNKEALDEMDRNARAYGWEIGQGKPLTREMTMSEGNPFNDRDWRDNLVREDAPDDLCPTCKETLPCTNCGAGL